MFNQQMFIVFAIVFLATSGLGFFAARWRAGDLNRLREWGLAGRRFGTLSSWFLIGGDVYSATTFIAWPGIIYAQGAIGFWGLPFAILMYLVLFTIMPRFWIVARHRGYITAADFVRDRFDSRVLTLLVATTGVLTTMPYIALQMIGFQITLSLIGLPVEAAIIIAFAILAAYTFVSGLRAPAVIAIVKDALIWLVVLVAIVYVPMKFGGFGHLFANIPRDRLVLPPQQYSGYSTLVFGSTLAIFLHPHIVTGVLSANSDRTVKRNAILLPIYTILLGMICLLSLAAVAIGVKPSPVYHSDIAFVALFPMLFPAWFAGIALAAIALGALVPASIMSISAANLFTRNIYREYLKPTCSEKEESDVARIASLLVKGGALAFVLFFPSSFAVNLQLLSSAWILQILPAVFIGLYTGWFHRHALIAGWLVGMVSGTLMIAAQGFSPNVPITIGGSTIQIYSALFALLLNLAVSSGLTLLLNTLGVPGGVDVTTPQDFEAEPVQDMSYLAGNIRSQVLVGAPSASPLPAEPLSPLKSLRER